MRTSVICFIITIQTLDVTSTCDTRRDILNFTKHPLIDCVPLSIFGKGDMHLFVMLMES
jgi:hypothetical protein